MAGFAAKPPCPTCGAANAAYATFCIECGEPLDAARIMPGGAARAGSVPAAGPAGGGAPVPRLRWELWLGAALILGVLGFALFDWQHQEEQAALYHQGDRAAAAHHWTTARAAFARQGDYRDARRRATEAATLVQRRDSNYQAAQDALRDNDLIAAYSALSQTLAIEPDYQAAPAQFARTGQAVVQAALANTVYRRISGGTPGLYARPAATDPDWPLPGSDGQSRVWTATAGGRIVYDGPSGSPSAAAPEPMPPGGNWDGRLPAGRQLWLAAAGSPAPPKPLPRTFGLGGGMAVAQDGVWWYDQAGSGPATANGYEIHGEPLWLLVYYDLETLRATEAVLTEGTYYLLDANAAGGQLLIGHYSEADATGPRTQLYLAGPTGRTLQSVATVAGVVTQAQISPDGRYVLYSASVPTAQADSARLELVAVDLTNPEHPAQVLARMAANPQHLYQWLQGTFVPGPGPPRVLIRRQVVKEVHLSVRNLANDVEETLWDGGQTLENYWLPADGQNLLLWDLEAGADPSLVIQPLNPRQPAIRLAAFPPIISTRPTFVAVFLTGDSVFYTVSQNRTSAVAAPVQPVAVYGAAGSTRRVPAVLLCRQRPRPDGDTRIVPLPLGVVACVAPDNSLRLRSPDGATNLTALDGVDALWPLSRVMTFWQP
jgi:hypothetical protein